MIEVNKEMTKFTNDVMFRIAELEIASQERITAMLATILANNSCPSWDLLFWGDFWHFLWLEFRDCICDYGCINIYVYPSVIAFVVSFFVSCLVLQENLLFSILIFKIKFQVDYIILLQDLIGLPMYDVFVPLIIFVCVILSPKYTLNLLRIQRSYLYISYNMICKFLMEIKTWMHHISYPWMLLDILNGFLSSSSTKSCFPRT